MPPGEGEGTRTSVRARGGVQGGVSKCCEGRLSPERGVSGHTAEEAWP